MADMVDTNSFKNGMHIELDGKVWRIVEFQHVKPGKGGAFVLTKLKNVRTGQVIGDRLQPLLHLLHGLCIKLLALFFEGG